MDDLIERLNLILNVSTGDPAQDNSNNNLALNPFAFEEDLSHSVEMNPETVQNIVSAAIRAASEQTKKEVQDQIKNLTDRLASLETPTSVEEYEAVTINSTIECNEPLDLVKTLPEFKGDQAQYVSWRQAAHVAYKLFEPYNGSSKHYQAVGIIRNKVTGSADSVLSSFNTVLNFKAIIARLDFTYADKKPIHLIEQEMSTLRQGGLSIDKFYDLVERKLTLLVNKTTMTYSCDQVVKSLNEKHRADALRVFISGLNRPLSDILFSAKPADMPKALMLAQELAANHARYLFAASFHDPRKFIAPKPEQQTSPHYRGVHKVNPEPSQDSYPQPMDIDPSTSRFRQNSQKMTNVHQQQQAPVRNIGQFPNNAHHYGAKQNNFDQRRTPGQYANYPNQGNNQANRQAMFNPVSKRQYDSERTANNNNKVQKINFLENPYLHNDQTLADPDKWETVSEIADQDTQDAPQSEELIDQINFLGVDPSCLM